MRDATIGFVLVAAGTSRRMRGVDKVWAMLGSHPVVWYSLRTFAPIASRCVLVVRPDRVDRARSLTGPWGSFEVACGGPERHDSVAAGLAVVGDVDVVAIHDAARPFADRMLLDTGVDLLRDFHGAIPVVPITDTVKQVDGDGRVTGSVDRRSLGLAQTPQMFRADSLTSAFQSRASSPHVITDDAQLLEQRGFSVAAFEGAPRNFKITTGLDLEVARCLLQRDGHPG